MMRSFSKNTLFFIPLLILFIVSTPVDSVAQMFSIEEAQERRERNLGAVTVIGLSWDIAEFTYSGDLTSGFERLDFEDSILRFRINSPGLDISFGVGGSFTGMSDNSYLNVSGRLFNNLNIKRTPDVVISIPVQLTTDVKRVRADAFNTEFQQSSLIFGSGFSTDLKLSDRFNFKMHATPNYGFSFSQGNFFGGTLFRFDGRAMIFINNIFGTRALAIGYDFDYRKYNIDGDLYDYDFSSHSVTLGIGL